MRRFALVGVVNTAIDFVLFGLLSLLGTPLLVANFVSTSCGMTFSYLANRSWTFRSAASVRRSLAPFLLVTATGLWLVQPVVIALVARVLTDSGLGVDLRTIWIPKAAAIGVGMVWNFAWYRWVVFTPDAPADPDLAAKETSP
jgi:putative flippase GtrA